MSLKERLLGSRRKKAASASIAAVCILVPLLVYAQTVSKILGSDGSNIADVTPANTAPAASKKALVVTISPNSPSPAGSQDVNLIKVGGSAIAIGQAAMSASLPVAIASNQSTLAISAASLPLPTGAAMETTLSAINAKFGTLGQQAMAGSAPVVIASNQSAVPISGTVTVTPSGTQNVNLTQVGSSAVALGQGAMAASIPVAIASNQSAVPASQSGTWSVNLGTTNGGAGQLALDATVSGLQVAQGSTTSGQRGELCQAAVTTAAPSYTNAQTSPLSLTTTGALRVDASASTQPVSGTVTANQGGAPWTVTGTGSAGTAATGVLTVQGIASMTPVQVSQATASNLNAQVVGAAASGAAVSGNPVLVAGSNSGTARSISVDASGQQVVVGPGTAGSASGGVLTVQGVASMTPVQVSQATASNLNAAVVGTQSDNSSNSTAKLPVIAARANAAAPSYTEGNQAPLSIDLGGLLRMYVGSWLGSTAPTVGQKANASSIPVTLSSDQVGTAGTAAAGVQTIQGIASMTPVQVSQATASNLNAQVVGAGASGAAVTGNPVLMAGSDSTNARTLRTDSSGRLTPAGNSWVRVSTNTSANIKSGACIIRTVCVGQAGATSAVNVYDNTTATGTIFASIDTTSKGCYAYNAVLTTGCSYQSAGGTPADFVVVYESLGPESCVALLIGVVLMRRRLRRCATHT